MSSVIEDINLTYGKTRKILLEAIKWETHVRPGFGKDQQDVIFQQIGDKYDIFLGIMWGRFGSPTLHAESGTEEEFNHALSRLKASPGSVEIMCYFKSAKIPPSADTDQLAKVQAFKIRVSSEGGLYSEFEDAEQFRTQVRRHLIQVIEEWPKKVCSDPGTAETTTAPSLDQSHEALNREALLASWPHSLQCYADSGNFRDSERNFQLFITPFSGKLSSGQIDALLVAVWKNRQNWDADGTPYLLKDLLENTSRADFPSAKGRNDFFKFLASLSPSQGQKDDIFSFLVPSLLSRYEAVILLLQTDGWMPPRVEDEE